MSLRRLLFWFHLVVGVAVGLMVAFLAATGATIAFEDEVIGWAERHDRIAQPAMTGCVAPSALLATAATATGQQPTGLTVFADAHRPAEVAFSHDTVVLMDACRGTIVDRNAGALRGFFWTVRELHHTFAFQGVRHETLRAVKSAACLAFVFLIASGLVLWVPRKMHWLQFRNAMLFRLKLHGRARDWNLHNVSGFWLGVPLLLIAMSGTIMAYPWANALLFRAAGEKLPTRQERPPEDKMPLDARHYPELNAALAAAALEAGAWTSLELRMPADHDRMVAVTADASDGARPQERTRIQVARKTAEVKRVERFADATRGRRWRLYARFLHTGELFGVAGKAVAFLAATAALVLVWTGFALSLRRWRQWRLRTSQ